MRIPLIGSSYESYSPAVSAQQSMNCYVESVETQGEKNKVILRGAPGITLFKDLATIDAGANSTRALFSGGGRLFVISGNKYMEVNSSGALVGTAWLIANDSKPAQILANSVQLFMVAGGNAYYDSGTGLTLIGISALSGKCKTNGTLVTIIPGTNTLTGKSDTFDSSINGRTIAIGTTNYTVLGVINPTTLVLTTSAGVQASADWGSLGYLSGQTAAFIDGSFYVPIMNTRQVNGSEPLDASTWDPLKFALKEGYTDNIRAIWFEPPFLYVLGTETCELWQNTGDYPFPLTRVSGGMARVGLAATWSPVSIMGHLHMLASGTYGGIVAVRMDGVTPVRVSNYAVEQDLNGMQFPNDGFSYSYVDGGHWFWVIGSLYGRSWVYDATESEKQGSPQWHERGKTATVGFGRYKAQFHTYIPEWGTHGKHIVGNIEDGKLYVMDSQTYTEDGADMVYVRTLAYVYNENHWFYHHRLELEFETGTTNPAMLVYLDWSDDRGQTFGTSNPSVPYLALGPGVYHNYRTRFFARALGKSRGRIYRIRVQGKGPLALIDATLEATEGTA